MNVKELLKKCQRDRTAVLATNFYNFETLTAVMQAAQRMQAPVLLQLTRSSIDYMGLEQAVGMGRRAIADYGVEGWIHLDHGGSVELVERCLDAGFDSVMIDASERPFDENVSTTRRIVELARPYGVNVEAELGYVAKLGQAQGGGFTTPEEAVKVIKSGDHVHLSSVASAPQCLINAMCKRGEAGELKDVHVHHLHTEGPAPYADPKFEGVFQLDSFFVGGNVRKVTQSGYADYIPIFLSETQKLYRSGTVPCDVAMIQVSTPDKHGYVSLGTSVDATLAAVETARTVIAVVNKHVPRSFGDAMIHSSKIDLFVQDDTPLEEAHFTEPNEIETRIGKHCAALIEDGATLQMGIGAIPNAVLAQLGNHKNLGIHTEMFADGVLPLVEKGVINGEAKNIDKGKMVSTFLMGSQRVYDFIDDNPGVLMMDVGYTNDPYIISQNDRFVAINSALQVDLTGQVSADSLGTKFWSGVGGQIDFVYGASLSKGGKAIIAMPSITNKGVSKICPTLLDGAGVVTTRNHIHWFVTEFGAVDLYGKTMQERARLLISVAHPSAREELDRAAFERWGSHHHYIKGYMG